MDDRLVRLECLKLSLSPNLGLQEKLATARAYEAYVKGESPSVETESEKRKPGRPRKSDKPSSYQEGSEPENPLS